MTEIGKSKDIVVFRKQITVDEPEAYAGVEAKFEGLTEEQTAELRKKFNSFFKDVEKIVKKETSLARKMQAGRNCNT